MAGGAYVALSGLRTRMDQLDRLASDIANVNTAGYKGETVTTTKVNRPDFTSVLQTAVDVAAAPGLMDMRSGNFTTTGRELDVALEGRGFFAVDTPGGTRYTRNGEFTRRADGTVTTGDGLVVQGDDGKPIVLASTGGTVSVETDGTVRTGDEVAGKLKVVDFDDYSTLVREDSGRLRVGAGTAVKAASPDTMVRGGTIEQSNVSMVSRMAQLTEVGRSFEALQRGVSTLMNDVDGSAIAQLGRR
jgi:flagellar basal-body rod protein FlgF